tara:strand:- start:18 stop:464 length:447 start_codon:yes stop_codon:yes gene_type:complete
VGFKNNFGYHSPMYKKLALCCLLILFTSPKVKAFEIDPRVKTFLVMNAYGVVGGLLLGSATLAFGTSGRSPFIGASLGLYAGLAFGGYVVVSHHMDEDRRLNPQNYEDEGLDDYGDMTNQIMEEAPNFRDKSPNRGPTIYLNLLKYNF